LKVKILEESSYKVVAVMDGDLCPAEDFLKNGEKSTYASRIGLERFLEHIAANGLQKMPAAWSHEVDKPNGIYEISKGRLRLFYFRGHGEQIVVCTDGIMKKGPKVDKQSVARAVDYKNQYFQAVRNKQIEVT